MNAILIASVVFFMIAGGKDLIDVSIVCLVAATLSAHHHEHQAEKMRRGKEILNRYSPERNPRPLGL